MSHDQNDRLQDHAQVVALRLFLNWSAQITGLYLQQLSEDQRSLATRMMRQQVGALRAELEAMTFPERDPVESDLWAQVAREEFDRVATVFLSRANCP